MVIAILAALLMPVLSRMRSVGKQTVCMNNLRQLALIFQLYVSEANGMLLPAYDMIMGMSRRGRESVELYFFGINSFCPTRNSFVFSWLASLMLFTVTP